MNIHTIDYAVMRFGLLLFIGIPVMEMYLLITVGSHIGALPTVALVVLTATVGIWLLKLEGLATLAALQEKANQGQIPGQELLEGVMLLIGGALLLTPGFVTDAIGFVCLLPGLRKPIAQWLINRGMMTFVNGMHVGGASSYRGTGNPNSNSNGTTIDGEFQEHNNPDHSSKRESAINRESAIERNSESAERESESKRNIAPKNENKD